MQGQIQYCKEEQGLVLKKLVGYEQQPNHGRAALAATLTKPS